MVIYHLKVKKKIFICIDLDRKYGGDWVTGWAKVWQYMEFEVKFFVSFFLLGQKADIVKVYTQ